MMHVLVTGSNGQLASCIKDLAGQYENLKFNCQHFQPYRYDACVSDRK